MEENERKEPLSENFFFFFEFLGFRFLARTKTQHCRLLKISGTDLFDILSFCVLVPEIFHLSILSQDNFRETPMKSECGEFFFHEASAKCKNQARTQLSKCGNCLFVSFIDHFAL